MADNFAFTEGSGKTGAADEISSVLYPRIKLIHGADGTNDGDVSTTNPLPVRTPLAVTLTNTPTVAGATHAAGDVVGSKISLSGAARVNAGSGRITGVAVCVTDAVDATYDVLFFDTDPSGSTFTDDAALNTAAADLPSCCGVAHCDDVVNMGTQRYVQMTNIPFSFKISASNTTLFAVIVARASAAFTTANGVTLRVTVSQD